MCCGKKSGAAEKSSQSLCGSITVMMSLIIPIIASLMLVALEQAYLYAGKTLALQTLNKAMESALGNFYAPLYTQYGLFALPVGEGLSYQSFYELEEELAQTVDAVFSATEYSDNTDSFFWNLEVTDCSVEDRTYLTDCSGELFRMQIQEAAIYNTAEEITDAFLALQSEDIRNIEDLLSGAKNQLESVKTEDEENADTAEEKEDEEAEAEKIYNTLVDFLKDGFSGWWFENAEGLSERKADISELPSFDQFGESIETSLFDEPELQELAFDNKEYLDALVKDSLVNGFQRAIEESFKEGSEKALLAGYSVMNMDSFLKDEVEGRLKYEQEYLIFGNACDETNVKRAGWSIFGIRLIANLIYFLSNPEAQEEIKEWVSSITVIAKWITILLVIVAVVLAVENAIVETAAILKGKSVDFAVTKASQQVKLSEIFSFSKNMIMNKAETYRGVSSIKLSYQMYLYLFMLMVHKDVLTYRMMDIIEMNMKKLYHNNFSLDRCLIGFSVYADYCIPPRFMNIAGYSVQKGSDGYDYRMSSAIMYQ